METLPALSHAVWERTPPEAQAYIRVLEARVETLVSMVHTFQEQVRTFQEQLNQTSRNSSRPPSSDPPSHARPPRPRSQRRRGGQPGHPGSTRPLLPVAAVDTVVVLKPEHCRHCHAPLAGEDPICIKLSCLTHNHGFRPRARPPYNTRILQSTGDSFGAFFFVCRATWGGLARGR